MAYFDDAQNLIAHAETTLRKIGSEYQASLTAQEVKPSLQIETKNFLENLRSALDFSSRGLFEKYGSTSKTDPQIYFPYARLAQSAAEFKAANRVEKCIPGLNAGRPDIVTQIEAYQHFPAASNEWLPLFMDLNNENKHEQLTPQERTETKQLRISSGGAGIALGEGTSIRLGEGASIRIGGATIRGAQTVSPASPAKISGPATQAVTVWVSFSFASNGKSVLPFLNTSLDGVRHIVDELATA